MKEFDILIVDDRQNWRDTLTDTLASQPYTVDTTTNYTEAAHALVTNHYRLAIVDIRLLAADGENEDGLRLLNEIDNIGIDTKIIIVAGPGTERQKEIANRSPRLLAYINKHEFNVTMFRNLVRQALEPIPKQPPE